MEPNLIGVSPNIQRIRALIDQIADTGLNTIIYGETGVGKELIVQCLYNKSNRTGKPFVKVNGAIFPKKPQPHGLAAFFSLFQFIAY